MDGLGTRDEQREKMREMSMLAEKENGCACKKCNGTGYRGWHLELQQYLPCNCINKAAQAIIRRKKVASDKN